MEKELTDFIDNQQINVREKSAIHKSGLKIGTFINGLRHGKNLKTGEGYTPGKQTVKTASAPTQSISNSNSVNQPNASVAALKKSNEGR